MNNAQKERMALLQEEAAEVIQIVSKIERHGFDNWNPFDSEKTPNRELLEKEIGHLLFAIALCVDNKDIHFKNVERHQKQKRETSRPYLWYNKT